MSRGSTVAQLARRPRLLAVPPVVVAAGLIGPLAMSPEETARSGAASATARGGATGADVPKRVVGVQILSVNDLHGHLEPPQEASTRGRSTTGGVAWLASHLDRAERRHRGPTIRVHAGDMLGASPHVSSHFHDEPTIRALNAMRFDVGALGNHELDEGAGELLRLLGGGRRSGPGASKEDADGRRVNTSEAGYPGAVFPYLAANTVDRRGRRILPPSAIVEQAGARIGFIAVTTESTRDLILPRHASRLRFRDVSTTVNRYARSLRRRGADAVVVLAHVGGFRRGAVDAGEVFDETREMSDAVDVVVSGHSHSVLDTRVPNRRGHGSKLVVQAGEYGAAYARIALRIDRAKGRVVGKGARIVPTHHRGVRPEASLAALVDRYAQRAQRVGRRVVGRMRVRLRRGLATQERPLGRFVARAQRDLARSDVALVDPVSVRSGLDPGPVTVAELFAMVPYEHPVVRARIRGADLAALLASPESAKLYVSGPPQAVEPGRWYTVAASELLMEGRRAPLLRERNHRPRVVGTELDALVAAFDAGQ